MDRGKEREKENEREGESERDEKSKKEGDEEDLSVENFWKAYKKKCVEL